jgi:branched-chain amino acid transport system ATP-binding protein
MDSILEVKQLSMNFGGLKALDRVDLDVIPGEITALIGPNGAGKTTTLMSITGIVPLRTSEIMFQNKPVHNLSPDEIVALGISLVPEGRRIFPRLTVMENLDMGTFLRKDKADTKKDINHIFELFPILAERRQQHGGILSGGEQQMLAISRALMARPRLLLLDEPSLGLGPMVVRLIFEIIKKINMESGTTIFLVEQNAHMALKVAHRGYIMENGRITLEGTADSLLHNEEVKRAYLGI